MNSFKFLFIAASFLFTSLISAQDLTENTFGNGIINTTAKDSSFSLKLGARFQTLFSHQLEESEFDEFETKGSDFLIRRARLKFDGFAYSPRLQYKIELGISNRDISGGNEFTGNTPRYLLGFKMEFL